MVCDQNVGAIQKEHWVFVHEMFEEFIAPAIN